MSDEITLTGNVKWQTEEPTAELRWRRPLGGAWRVLEQKWRIHHSGESFPGVLDRIEDEWREVSEHYE